DAAVMGAPNHVRSDVSFTIFLSDPDSYEGGELAFEHGSGEMALKLPARSAICYPTGQLHRVRPVESGERIAIVGWVQSLVREPAMREMLHALSAARTQLTGLDGAERALGLVNKCYSNLRRPTAEPRTGRRARGPPARCLRHHWAPAAPSRGVVRWPPMLPDTTALIVVDLQPDFMPGGALPCHEG